MKKTLAKILVLTVVLATGMFMLAACGGGDSPYVGTWKAVKFEAYGVTMTPDEAGLTFSVDVKSNGDITATTNGEDDGAGEWEATDDGIKITSQGSEYTATINDDGQLVLEMEGIKFYMEKE